MANREYVIVDCSSNYGSGLNRYLCVDTKIFGEVSKQYKIHQEKLMQIQERILTLPNMYYDYYGKEGYDTATKDITAIKLLDQQNTRFYCQEKKTKKGILLIICGAVFSKKTQRNNKKNKSIITTLASYIYEERKRKSQK